MRTLNSFESDIKEDFRQKSIVLYHKPAAVYTDAITVPLANRKLFRTQKGILGHGLVTVEPGTRFGFLPMTTRPSSCVQLENLILSLLWATVTCTTLCMERCFRSGGE